MATIKDVARLAGVSVSTISKYLNGGNVLEENAESIRKAIAELDYRVNPFARSLKTQRSKSIGVLLPDITAPFFGNVLVSLDKVLREHGYHTLISCYSASYGLERENLQFLINNGIDGLIYAPENLTAEDTVTLLMFLRFLITKTNITIIPSSIGSVISTVNIIRLISFPTLATSLTMRMSAEMRFITALRLPLYMKFPIIRKNYILKDFLEILISTRTECLF